MARRVRPAPTPTSLTGRSSSGSTAARPALAGSASLLGVPALPRAATGATAVRSLLDVQATAGNRAATSLLEVQRDPCGGAGCGCTGCADDEPAVVQRTADPPALQRQGAPNVLRHHGRWTDIDSPAVLRLWAKEAAVTKLWTSPTLLTLQEAPESTPQVVEAALQKLRKSLYSAEDFTGSPEARRDAEVALQEEWPTRIRPDVQAEVVRRYTGQLTQALAHTPKGTELVTRPEEVARIRRKPYGQLAYTGYGKHMLHKGDMAGHREVVDIQGCGSLENCGKGDTEHIWFILKRDWRWIYDSHPRLDLFNWHVESVAKEVAESTKLAGQLFPLMLKLAGFTLGLSSRLAIIVAAEVIDALGEQGLRQARGEEMQSAGEVLQSVGFGVFVGHVTNRMFGEKPGGPLAGDLEHAAEEAGNRARREVATTDASVVERELRAGKARPVKDSELAGDGYRSEVDVVSEGQAHTWRQKVDGGWCRFSRKPVCVGKINDSVDEAARQNPVNFERNLAEAGVSKPARKALGRDTLSVDDLLARQSKGRTAVTAWTPVRSAVERGGDELRVTLGSEYGLVNYIRYHILAPGLGREGSPILLAPQWMNHGANRIEGFMRAQRKAGFTVRYRVTRNSFDGSELRPFYENLLRTGDPKVLGRLALDRGRIEPMLKNLVYEIEVYRRVGGRTQLTRLMAGMEAGVPPVGGQIRWELPTPVR